jgi:hypothetical protein
LIVRNCPELFTKDKFSVHSNAIELVEFKWQLIATTFGKGFLALYLHAYPPDGFKGHYRIEVDLLVIQNKLFLIRINFLYN